MGLKPYLWQNPDGTYQGAEYELTKYVVEKLGIPRFEYVVLEWASLIPGLKAKRFDLTGTIGITQERAQGAGISFSRPFLMIYDRVIVLHRWVEGDGREEFHATPPDTGG